MVYIPGGTFMMGIDEADLPEVLEIGKKVPHMSMDHVKWWYADELPRHEITVAPFFMDKYEVANAQFREFVRESGYKPQGDWKKYADEGRDNHPVVDVNWFDATAYAEWAGKRLPTEEEWEYAALGGKNVKWYPWDDTADPKMANYNYEGETFWGALWWMIFGRKIGTSPVGTYPPNGYGLYDMIGNAGEWCSNNRKPYSGWDKEGWVVFNRSAFTKDKKPFYGRALRGGSWTSSNPVFIRLTNRHGLVETTSKFDRGFRCVKSVE